jgi:hypothetical protein
MHREIRICAVSGDYDGALSVFNEMVSVLEYAGKPLLGVYCDIMHRYAYRLPYLVKHVHLYYTVDS